DETSNAIVTTPVLSPFMSRAMDVEAGEHFTPICRERAARCQNLPSKEGVTKSYIPGNPDVIRISH
ncbi:MAG: hypothetical protein KJO13_06055, partial [Gammaproteobacteria bacterium]|nr:hypothetical protein [Gammaproteobacteria bacterium]